MESADHNVFPRSMVLFNISNSSIIGVGVVDGILYAVGGHDGPLVRKSVEAYNPETKTWTPVADMAFCRRNAGEFLLVIFDCFSNFRTFLSFCRLLFISSSATDTVGNINVC